MALVILSAIGAFIAGLAVYHFRVQKLLLEHGILKEKLAIQEKVHQEASEKLELKLKTLTQEIFEEKSRRFREDSLRGMELVLNPFREKMADFQKRVEEMHLTDTKDRLKLHSEIERIVMTGQKMTSETENLTRALKGDVKMQGNWGEMILEKLLEASGLRNGEEFILQGKEMGLKDEEGRTMQPDVIINLPENKHLIVDSKVSLVAYERFVNEGQEEDLSHFLDSLYAHIKGLSSKNYQRLDKLQTPDYVMLFIPIEGAFMLAMQKDRELFNHAWDRNIMLVGPSTLLATLRTVASLWKQERQTKNAIEIARQAGALYDKFVGVANDLDSMQNQIKRVGDSFEDLKSRMLTGKGSLASRMENLKELGAKTTKSLELS
ncbi:DNA recombination protein RmuC [Peredibacter starrii]|uniref:DNA recombination protein RmuC n=1 Tax=Peredibacter starrii TaxID=28202 RepID=A0AAX4HK71_9BACT|nr:DNA recombination protein RmuC [Peredibacter starrii]WPU63637.1 DNA recombination protein RmuC [Peredibacter starrii]